MKRKCVPINEVQQRIETECDIRFASELGRVTRERYNDEYQIWVPVSVRELDTGTMAEAIARDAWRVLRRNERLHAKWRKLL